VKVLAHVHQFPPTHNAGAEWMLHDILHRLVTVHGHECTVITNRPPKRDGMVGPIRVISAMDQRTQRRHWVNADVVITHLDATGQCVIQQRTVDRPLVHLVHNHNQLAYHQVKPRNAQLVVANSDWIRRSIDWTAVGPWPGDAMVVIPPVWPERVVGREGPHDAVVLLNVSKAKGAEVFFDLAEALPGTRFVGVAGAYDTQLRKALPNVEMWKHTADVANVYAQARVVVMPSSYESWGRVAVEAACCNVPCVAGITPGLVETGVPYRFAGVDAVQGGYEPGRWLKHVRGLLDDDDVHVAAGAAAHARSVKLETLAKAQVDDLSHRLERLVR